MSEMVVGAILGLGAGVFVGLVMLVVALLVPKSRVCPECGTPAPKIRMPANSRELYGGGWTCPECDSEMDASGRKIETED